MTQTPPDGGLPDPEDLVALRPHSREELAQLCLTTLVLGHVPLRWNHEATPTARGRQYLDRLDTLAFGQAHGGAATFVDEYELLGVNGHGTGSPDHAARWSDRVLLIELKTEKPSHRPGQCERYLDLARHHNPGRRVDLVYLTGPMPVWAPIRPAPVGSRTAHLTWGSVLPVVDDVWGEGVAPADERAIAVLVAQVLDRLDLPWSRARDVLAETYPVLRSPDVRAPVPRTPNVPRLRSAATSWELPGGFEDLALAVAQDREQRGLPVRVDSPEELAAVRESAAAFLRERALGAGHVRPWIWRAATTDGSPLTAQGAETGYELRLSWYRAALAG